MSDDTDLTRRIKDAILEQLAVYPGLPAYAVAGNAARAIASLIAEREAAARREALEEAATIAASMWPRGSAHTYASENADRYHALEDASEHIAAAIRSLANEATNGQ